MPEDEAETGKKGKGRKGKGRGRGKGKGKGRGKGKGQGKGKGKTGKGRKGRKATKKMAPDFDLSAAASQEPKQKTDQQEKKRKAKKSSTDLSQLSLPEATAPPSLEPTPKRSKRNAKAVKPSVAEPVETPPKKGRGDKKQEKVVKESKKKVVKESKEKVVRQTKHHQEREKHDIPTFTHCAINAYWSRDAAGVKLKIGGKLGREAGFVTCVIIVM